MNQSRLLVDSPAASAKASDEQLQMGDALRSSLARSPRSIPPIFFYDALGSALFDAICNLPWYPITRAELALLDAHSHAIGELLAPRRLVELGSGNGRKAATLARGLEQRPLDVHLIDISGSALATAGAALSAVPGVQIVTHEATYEAGLTSVAFSVSDPGATLVAFLGSNIGNFEPHEAWEFLCHVRSALSADDWLLLGADLVKTERELLQAYDDPLGVTAAFNKNVLAHINREMEADFELDAFAHLAIWRAEASRVEMHLVSLRRQTVTVPAAGIEFTLLPGETIWTESSYKYEPHTIVALGESAGFVERAQWIEPVGGFALTLFSTS